MMSSLQVKLQSATSDFQKIQADLTNVVDARQRLGAQLTENESVRKEFAQLQPGNIIFKQTGPVMVKQDQQEAKANIDTRLDFIRSEIKRVENQIKDIQTKADAKKAEILDIQTAAQQQSSQQGSALPQ